MAKPAAKTRRPEETRKALIRAATSEFETNGYDGTNTNKIAIKAGYAPQTFYRYFNNKLEIFLAVYQRWIRDSSMSLDEMRSSEAAARFAITHHKKFLHFRRALRHLAIVEPKVRAARAASRLDQIKQTQSRLPHLAKVEPSILLAGLLQIERLVDACAEGEFDDLGITDAQAVKELAQLMQSVFGHQAPIGVLR